VQASSYRRPSTTRATPPKHPTSCCSRRSRTPRTPLGQPFWATDGGINNFATHAPATDRLLPGRRAPAAQAAALYRTIGRDFVASSSVISIADVKDTLVLRKDLTGIEHSPADEWYVNLAALRRT
jgi:hypothetical protein